MSDGFDCIISGDSHVREPADLWWNALGKKLGDRAPRPLTEYKGRPGRFFFTGQRVSKYGVAQKPPEQRTPDEDLIIRSGYESKARVEFQQRAGLAAEIIYPSLCAQIIAVADPEVAQAACRVYNDWIAEFCARDPRRLVGTAVVPIHSIDWAIEEVKRTAKLGLRGAVINVAPPPVALPFIDPAYDRFWAACVEARFPVILHIITGQEVDPLVYGLDREDYKQAPRQMFAVWNEVQETLANDFIFGGILDRHPALAVLLGEYELSWLPHFMFRLDQIQNDFTDYLEMPKLKMRASEYLRTRVYHGMVDDPYAADGLARIGTSQVLWGSDFPHVRSIDFNTKPHVAAMYGHLSPAVQADLVGGNATRLFNL